MPYRQVGLICPSESVRHLIDYLKKLRFEVRALWTPEPELTIQAAAEYEIPFSASRPDEVLLRKEVQLIIITGRPQIHSQIAIKALGIGKHVLCDAPVTLNGSDALKMVQAAQYYPQLLALVGYGLRHLEVFRRAKQLIDDGYVGTPLVCECSVRTGSLSLANSYNWLWEHSMGGGILNLIGCHVIDIISYLIQRRATRVQGVVKCIGVATSNGKGYSVEDFPWMNGGTSSISENAGAGFRRVNSDDFASFIMKFDNDFVATITLNALSAPIHGASSNGPNDETLLRESLPATTRGCFHQRILISGNEGQLEISNYDIYGKRFRGDCTNGTASTNMIKCGSTTSGCMEVLYNETDRIADSSTADQNNFAAYSIVPEFYVQGFMNLLLQLAETLPEYEMQQAGKVEKAAITWQTGCLASLASFEDAQYVRAVIDAIRHSSEKGDWVKVDLHSS